nr:MAG TPA: hypothetical protein [Bacteriophage sp.]DAR58968.1 MAG TPA: hypothetical protein [Caudoviricetes sp.]
MRERTSCTRLGNYTLRAIARRVFSQNFLSQRLHVLEKSRTFALFLDVKD